MVTAATDAPVIDVNWRGAVRIIRSAFPPIDLFEDIADPADWPLLISAEQKTNPRLMENLGNLDLVPPRRRVGGPGATYLMAPFTHVSRDRPSRFSDGGFGVLYVADLSRPRCWRPCFITPNSWPGHASRRGGRRSSGRLCWISAGGCTMSGPMRRSMTRTIIQAARRWGWRCGPQGPTACSTVPSAGRAANAPDCFTPTSPQTPRRDRHLDYHWDGGRIDLVRDAGRGAVFRVV